MSATGRIVIVKVPKGEAPKAIRKMWLGIVLPCEPILGFSEGFSYGVLSGEEKPPYYGFHVPQWVAIRVLGKTNPRAARWWREHGFPHYGRWFTFDVGEAWIISGVTRQQIIEITDEMDGDPNR